MSCLATALVACNTLQADLTTYFETCNHGFIREPMPFAEFVASDMNNRGLRNIVAPGKGKKRIVELIYTSRIPESAVVENDTDICTCDTIRGNCSQVYEIDADENSCICEKIRAQDLRDMCKDNGLYFAERMAYLMDALERRLATKITQQAVALTGKWASDVTPVNASNELVIKTKKDGDPFVLNPYAFEEIDRAVEKTGYCQPYALFAGDELVKYYRSILAGCCANNGIDLGEMFRLYGKAVLYDRRVSNAFGGEFHGILTQPGALALLWWNEAGWNDGMPIQVFQGANYVRTMAISPRLGIPVDIIIKDECPGEITITMCAVVKLVNMPADIFPAGDVYNGVNFFNEILVQNSSTCTPCDAVSLA